MQGSRAQLPKGEYPPKGSKMPTFHTKYPREKAGPTPGEATPRKQSPRQSVFCCFVSKQQGASLAVMSEKKAAERMLFTFQSNGEADGRRMVEAVAEHMVIHEAPVGPDAEKRSWFGTEDALPEVFKEVGFSDLDIEGVLAGLRVNRVETREIETVSEDLNRLGFVEKDSTRT